MLPSSPKDTAKKLGAILASGSGSDFEEEKRKLLAVLSECAKTAEDINRGMERLRRDKSYQK